MRLPGFLFLLLAILPPLRAQVPLVDLPLAGDLVNRGSLGGEAVFMEYAPGEGPVWDVSPLGTCVDFTRASRQGGAVEQREPAGGAVVFPGEGLRDIATFTIVLWARQNPLAEGSSARLAMTETGWDLMPGARGVILGFLDDEGKKTFATLNAAPFARGRIPQNDEWRFLAVAVDTDTLRGCIGGLDREVEPFREVPRPAGSAAQWGDLVIGNLMQIRPFNGWMARFRVYDRALSMEEMAALAAADRADAAKSGMALLQPRPATVRPPFFRHSAIPFSTRWQRPQAFEVMDAFHATDCLWVYGNKPEYAAAVQATGRRYQGAMHGLQGLEKATTEKTAVGDPSGRHEDLDGNKNMPRWMVTFSPRHFTGCCNHHAFRDIFFADARAYVEMGVDMIHVDDSAMNASWVKDAGVCFCDHCRAGFREFLRTRRTPDELRELGIADIAAFDYRDHLRATGIPDAATYRKEFNNLPLTPDFIAFQTEVMRDFYRELRALLDQWSPDKHIAVSVNELLPLPVADRHGRLYHADLVDFYHGEAYDRTFAVNLTGNKTAEALGLQNISTPVLQGVADGARSLALAYALGQFQLVPWDVYMGSDETGSIPRYNGTREDFGSYYDLIHSRPQLFDTARSLAAVGVLVNADIAETPQTTRLCEELAARQIPFHLIVAATRQARIPLRADDLRGLRVLIAHSPVESLADEDRATLETVLAERRLRVVGPEGDWAAFLAARGLDALRFEGPPGVYLFPRQAADGRVLVHLVNWNIVPGADRPESYRSVTVALRRWGAVAKATYWQPGAEPVEPTVEPHAEFVRFTLPQLDTWGILELTPR